MPFIPHTELEAKDMLKVCGVDAITDLFAEIPSDLMQYKMENIPDGMTECELARLMQERQADLKPGTCFIGAGAYDHYIPAAIWDIAGRSEFLTAYTPYQAEASQGNLQLIYEYQTMMASLTGMDVSNASLYDGASGLTEAVLMAVRLKRGKATKIIVPDSLHPHYRQVLQTVLPHQNIELISLPFDSFGVSDQAELAKINCENVAAIIIAQPNFFGRLENVNELTSFAEANNIFSIALVNPLSLSLLKEPGAWGELGVDIVCGEGQPLGVPLSFGGPYFGFLCCKKKYVRQLPGRIVGRTKDDKGRVGYVLTLQAREQHIRRAKATSNICTNQGLLVTAASIYMSLLGPQGLTKTAEKCHFVSSKLYDALIAVDGIESVFGSDFFHEFVIKLPIDAKVFLQGMRKHNIQAGVDLGQYFPALKNCLLICATETKNNTDLQKYLQVTNQILTEDAENGLLVEK